MFDHTILNNRDTSNKILPRGGVWTNLFRNENNNIGTNANTIVGIR